MNSYRNKEHPSIRTGNNPNGLKNFAVAMGYVPWQYLTTLYEPDKALKVLFFQNSTNHLKEGECAHNAKSKPGSTTLLD